ncbi:MAG: HDIG domain-containing protein [Bacteroidales bacterium]|nr:HDIG domain-containing protein [Bacteroidales bacterium]
MAKTYLPKDPRIYYLLGLLFLMLLFILPRSGKFNYDYKKGTQWPYETLIAQFDFPILKTAEELDNEKAQAGTSVIPYFRFSEESSQNSMKAVSRLDINGDLKHSVISALTSIYSRGVIPDKMANQGSQTVVFLHKDKRAYKTPISNIYTVSSARSRLYSELAKNYEGHNLDSLLKEERVYDVIVPNLVYDKESSELVHAQSSDFISPTKGFVHAGQVIISKDEIVTGEIHQILDSYKAEYEENLGYSGPRIMLWLGNAIIALALVLILFLSVYYTNPDIFNDINRFVYLLFIFVLTTLMALLMDRFNAGLLYLVPFSITALYLRDFFRKRVVMPVYILSLLPLLIFTHDGVELFVMFLVSGVVTIYVFDYFHRGWLQFVTAFIAFSCLLLTYIGFRLINDVEQYNFFSKVFFLFIGSMLSVALYPLIFLFERIFGLVSESKLAELADTNNPLLVELSQKAPGTFQHSLQVMNMAETAARSIEANVLLIRAGALYHDIGKMENPLCFVENESADNTYHNDLTPKESARDILRHVTDGVMLAEKSGLPDVIKGFILSHHGTSTTMFFYNKFLNAGGDPAERADFTYKGRKPRSTEETLVMICDSLEAASRTLKDNKPETYDVFVEKMVQAKIDDGQFDDSAISLKELTTVKSVLKTYLVQLYHDRVAYPKRRK